MLNITFDSWLLLHIWLFVKLYWTLKMMLKWFNVQCYFGNVRNTIIGMQLKVASLSLQVQNLYIQISVNSYIVPKQKLFMQQLILIYFLTLRDLLVLRWYDSENSFRKYTSSPDKTGHRWDSNKDITIIMWKFLNLFSARYSYENYWTTCSVPVQKNYISVNIYMFFFLWEPK